MVSNLKSSLLATLVLGMAVTAGNARAEAAADASADAALAALAAPAANADYNCINGLCVGMTVRVVGGEWAGHAGSIVSIDEYQDTITVLNSSGYYLYPRSYDVIADVSQPSDSGCVGAVCVGDQVRILYGAAAGRIGTVVDADEYNYRATILVDGRYVIEDARDLSLYIRPTSVPTIRYYARNCAVDYYVYDIFRGCVRISYAYPRPFIHPVPYPRMLPRRAPPPRVIVMPRRYPTPRGPMPGHPMPQGPRGPVIINHGPVIVNQGPRGNQGPSRPQMPPQGPRGNQGPSIPQPPRGNQGPSRPQMPPQQGPSRPSMPSQGGMHGGGQAGGNHGGGAGGNRGGHH